MWTTGLKFVTSTQAPINSSPPQYSDMGKIKRDRELERFDLPSEEKVCTWNLFMRVH
jgi:hypothetical protein